jgi:hypothetical protein
VHPLNALGPIIVTLPETITGISSTSGQGRESILLAGIEKSEG